MRVHRLHLRDVKGVVDRTVDFPDTGIVVIEGPNEIGKSTLLEAFDMLLDPRAKATSQSKAVKALKPVDRDAGPRVEAEFTVGSYRVRFAKQWLRGAATELEILEPVREQLTGEAAQHRLDGILAASLDRPLWDALRFTQAGELGQMALTDSAVLTEALDGASGVELHAADGAPLLGRVEAEYLRYYTPTGRVGGELKAAVAVATAARDAAALAHGELLETQALVEEHQRLRERASALLAATDDLDARLQRFRKLDAVVAELVRAHEEATAALARAREDVVRARADLDRRERAAQELADAATRLEAAEKQGVVDRQALDEATRQTVALAEARDSTRRDRDTARLVADRAQEDAEHLAAREGLARLSDRLDRLVGLRADEAAARAALVAAVDVDAGTVRALESAERQLLQLRARQEASSARVSLESIAGSRSITVNGEAVDVRAGEEREVPLRGGLEIELPGELRVVVRPGEGASELAGAVEEAEATLQELLAGAAVPDVSTAREAATERATARARVRAVGERIADVLAGQTEQELKDEVASLRDRLSAQAADRPADQVAPENLTTGRAVARAALKACREAESAAEQAEGALAEHGHRTRQLEVRVEKLISVLETQTTRLEEDRARLVEAQRSAPDEALRQAVSDASTNYARVEARAAVTRRELDEADVDGVRARLADAERACAAHAAEVEQVRHAQAQLQGKVELVSGEGRQEVYDVALAEFARLRAELGAVHRRARAARQLWETLTRHREAAHRAYVLPYQEEIKRLGQVVYGDSFDVAVGEDLTIRSRSLHGISVPFEQLSGGAKEQLGILSRLAVASLVESGEGVPVIIDDALGYTDPDRLQRVSSVFGGPGQRTQVVLLTCTPERYRQIADATTIQLTA